MYVKCIILFMELQQIKLTAVIDSHMGNRAIPWDSPNKKKITHDAHPLQYFVTQTSIYSTVYNE